jgi:hypothetical protein
MIIHEGTFLSVEEGGHFYPLLTHTVMRYLTLHPYWGIIQAGP